VFAIFFAKTFIFLENNNTLYAADWKEDCSCKIHPSGSSEIQQTASPEEILMRTPFLFRIPGQHGMYDFDEIRGMHLPRGKMIEVTECMKPGQSRGVGSMSIATILSKFG